MRDPNDVTDAERMEVQGIEKLFSELQTYRNVFAGQWEESANLILPTSRNTFFYGSYNWPGQKKTQQQVDATGARALNQFSAICDSMVTPKNGLWHGLASDPYVMKDPATRAYFQQVRDILFDYRYRPAGNFHGQNYNNWQSLGAFGNSTMFCDALDTRVHRGRPGLRYKSVPLGETFYGENHQGIVTVMCRWFRLTAQQAVEKFGEDWLPQMLEPAIKQNLQTPYDFLHCVRPRDPKVYDPDRFDHIGMPFSSHYVCLNAKQFMCKEGGFRVFPYAVSRYDQTPGECYGRGPAQLTLPALKTLNAEKAVFLKTGHRAGDPIYLIPDDGLIDFDQTPGAMNKGGVNAQGQPLVHVLEAGNVQITEEMMKVEAGIIDDVFMTSLFKVLVANPNMTATQVIELMNERGMLVAPTLGRQHNEYVGGLVERELDVLAHIRENGKPVLPPQPQRLKEAAGHYEITDTSPLAMQAKMGRSAGFMRLVETAKEIVNVTGDVSHLDYFNFGRAVPAMAEINDVEEDWMSTPKEIATVRQARAKQVAQQQQVEALPKQAAMLNAQAKIAKAQPGVLGAPGAQPQPGQIAQGVPGQ